VCCLDRASKYLLILASIVAMLRFGQLDIQRISESILCVDVLLLEQLFKFRIQIGMALSDRFVHLRLILAPPTTIAIPAAECASASVRVGYTP
jgi:hypothetical protein